MTFLVLLLTVGAYKLLGWHFRPEHDRWFAGLSGYMRGRFSGSPRFAMLLTLLLPLTAAALVLMLVQDWIFGFAGVALQALVLSYALGRVNLPAQVNAYLAHWREGDFQSAYHHAQQYFNLEQDFDAASRSDLHVKACRGVLYQWFEQVFVIIFWYLLLGPIAALFMRLLSLYERGLGLQEPSKLLHILEWLPVRLLAFIYAIAGNFSQCFKAWRGVVLEPKAATEQVLFRTGLAAIALDESQLASADRLGQEAQLQTLEALQVRSLLVCLILVALFVII